MDKTNKAKYFTSIKQFKFIDNKQIGKGSFGQVRLAIHVFTNKIFAIKIIETNEIKTEVGIKALERETCLHPFIDHPHIIRLWQVFQEDQKMYMVMEYAEKGNLFYYQNKRKVFSQEEAFNFFSQTVSAVQYMHNLNLVHRDLKPENLLLDKDLNIKICDLGWIVEGIHQTHTTFCGTYEYMAPQMIFNAQYDCRVDIWALGILLYQMLHGFAPFEGNKAEEVRKSMLEGEIHMDPQLSENSQDLIFKILKVQPNERLTLEQIKSHEWINQMKRKKLTLLIESFDKNFRERTVKKDENKEKKFYETDHFKGLPKKLLETMKDKKKSSPSQLRNNLSVEQINIRKSSKQKGDSGKPFRESSGKKIFAYHHTQNLGVSEIGKKQRLKTEINEKSARPEILRFNTEICQNMDVEQRAIKKTKVFKKGLPYAANLIKRTLKNNLARKSID